MTMAIVFGLMDLFLVAITYGVYGGKTKYYEGMILGVHMEEQYAKGTTVTAFIQDYKKKLKRFYVWNLIVGILLCGLCFWYFSIFMIAWCVWLIEFMAGSLYLIYRNHRRLYDMKVAYGWGSEESGQMMMVDTRLSSGSGQAALPLWLHLLTLAVLAAPFVTEKVRAGIKDIPGMGAIFGAGIAVWVTFLFCAWIFRRQRNRVYSEDSQINRRLNDLEKRYWSAGFLTESICNDIATLYLIYAGVKNGWISNVDMVIYTVILFLAVVGIFVGYWYLRKVKQAILQMDKTPLFVDDDYYWRNGWYSNPDDSRLFIQDRFNGMNYTTNLGRPVGRCMVGGVLAGTMILLVWVCIMMLRMDFVPVYLADSGSSFKITSGYTNTEIKKEDIKSVKLLKNGLPKEHFSKTNGSADEKQLLGKFDGAESEKCRMYVWLEQSEVIQIKTKKYTVFMNNKDKDQTTAWYEQLKKAEP